MRLCVCCFARCECKCGSRGDRGRGHAAGEREEDGVALGLEDVVGVVEDRGIRGSQGGRGEDRTVERVCGSIV